MLGRRCAAWVLLGSVLLVILSGWGWWQYHYRAALEAMNRFQFERAQGHLDKCLRLWPRSVSINLLAARLARLSGNYELAREHIFAAEKWGGVNPATAFERTLQKAQRGDLKEVESFLLELLKKGDARDREILDALVLGYTIVGRWAEALHCANILLEKEPDHPKALFCRATVYENEGQNGRAIEDLRQAIKINPHDDDIRFYLASLLAKAGQIREAVAYLELLRRRKPNDPLVVVELARCQFDLHQREVAGNLLDALLSEKPNCVAALVERSRLALHLGSIDEAEGWGRKAVHLDSHDREAHQVLCASLEASSKVEEAAQFRTRLNAIEINEQRIAFLTDEMNKSPSDLAVRYKLGMELIKQGRKEMARNMFISILRIDPSNQDAAKAMTEAL